MKVLSSITDTQDAVNKEYIDGLLADYAKTANVYSKTESDGRYFPLAGNKTITGPVRIESELTVTGTTSLNSTLSVSGQATLSGGAFLPPSKTILFQDAATETFTISFNSEVGGLNLSGATRTLGLASFQKGIQIEHGQSIAFVDSNGVKQYITLDEENGAIKVIGKFFATGQNAAGGVGEVTGESGSGVANVEIKVNALSAYDGRTITTNAMQTLTGLSVDVAQSMLEGAYNKVIDNSDDYPEVWDYTARGTSTGIIIYLRIGDGYDTNTAYALTYTQSAANWSIIMGEI